MRVAEVAELVGPDGVRVAERAEPGGLGVRVAVRAVGLSYPDLLRSRGEYQEAADLPYVVGQEFCGIVVDAPGESAFAAGDRVTGTTMTGVGAAAEAVVAPSSSLYALPDSLSFEEGAGAIFNYQTAVVALEFRGRLATGETVLVHGAAGGTGTAAIQVAKTNGARTIAVVSEESKRAVAKGAGADEVVGTEGGWKDQVAELTGGRGVDVVFDPVGGDRMIDTIRSLAFGGRWVIVGFAGGGIPQIPANRLLLKNVEAVGSYVAGYLSGEADRVERLRTRIDHLLASGAIRPPVGATYPLERTADGLRDLDERRAHGKVVISLR